MSNNHVWNFSSVGGVKRVNLESGKDLLNLESLDQKLWTALSCPVEGLEIDAKTLDLIDSDKDGRIRVPEIIEAVKWITSLINNADELLLQNPDLPLSSINQKTKEGKKLFASAKQILENLNLPESTTISVEQTSDIVSIFAKTKFNGDGIITLESADDDDTKKLIEQIILCCGSLKDRSGKKGISEELIELFYKECTAFSTWQAKAENDSKTILPYGASTELALNSFLAVKSKIEDYFIRCRLAEFDQKSAEALNLLTSRVESISSKDLSTCMDEIATYPLSKIAANQSLSLTNGINPAWEKSMADFIELVVKPIFNSKNELNETEWNQISKIVEPYISWKAEKVGDRVEQLGLDSIRAILANNKKETLLDLLKKDKALEGEANDIILVDKLARYYRDLFRLLKNFVTFYDFYSPDKKAIFQNGVLFIDQRSCDLCIHVNNMDKHNTMVSLSGMYLIYCDCTSKQTGTKMSIVAAMTNGDVDNLMVGRNAVFYDRNGLDWDATVTKIIENPISIRQAFWSPYRKISRFIESQVEKFASEKEKDNHESTTKGIETATSNLKAAEPAKAPPVPFDIGKFVGIFAALSLALGAIGGVLASFISGFLGLIWWQMPLALCGLMLGISGPSMIIAWLKLRKRNLAPILDANGWAINARAIINIPFGNTLTHLVKLPENSKINLNDPFKKKRNPVVTLLLYLALISAALFFILWKLGILQSWLNIA